MHEVERKDRFFIQFIRMKHDTRLTKQAEHATILCTLNISNGILNVACCIRLYIESIVLLAIGSYR